MGELDILLDRITDISVLIHTFDSAVDNGRLSEPSHRVIKIADGRNCYKKIVWADVEITQDQQVDIEKTIPISYKVDGNEYVEDVFIMTRRTNGWWKFGVMLEDNLHLRFFLGTEDNYSESELIPLKLI